MSDEWDWFDTLPSSAQEQLVSDEHELRRLRAENEAMRAIVQAVADADVWYVEIPDAKALVFDSPDWERADQIQEQARALLEQGKDK